MLRLISNSLAVWLLLPVFCQWLTALSHKSWLYIYGMVVIKKCLLYYSFNYKFGVFTEVVIQMAVYAGVPACMNGLTAYREAMAATDHELPNI